MILRPLFHFSIIFLLMLDTLQLEIHFKEFYQNVDFPLKGDSWHLPDTEGSQLHLNGNECVRACLQSWLEGGSDGMAAGGGRMGGGLGTRGNGVIRRKSDNRQRIQTVLLKSYTVHFLSENGFTGESSVSTVCAPWNLFESLCRWSVTESCQQLQPCVFGLRKNTSSGSNSLFVLPGDNWSKWQGQLFGRRLQLPEEWRRKTSKIKMNSPPGTF